MFLGISLQQSVPFLRRASLWCQRIDLRKKHRALRIGNYRDLFTRVPWHGPMLPWLLASYDRANREHDDYRMDGMGYPIFSQSHMFQHPICRRLNWPYLNDDGIAWSLEACFFPLSACYNCLSTPWLFTSYQPRRTSNFVLTTLVHRKWWRITRIARMFRYNHGQQLLNWSMQKHPRKNPETIILPGAS